MLEAGIDLLTIQRILGHTSLTTTARYTHVRRDYLRAVAQVLELLPLEQLRRETSPAPASPARPSKSAT